MEKAELHIDTFKVAAKRFYDTVAYTILARVCMISHTLVKEQPTINIML
jgi:hypothetical protein